MPRFVCDSLATTGMLEVCGRNRAGHEAMIDMIGKLVLSDHLPSGIDT
jgi:hypothetical protein